MGRKFDRGNVKRLDPPEEERRKYLKTVGALVAGLAIGGAAGWLSKPAERVEVPGVTVTEKITETVPGPTVTKTVTAPITPTPTPTVKPLEGVTLRIIGCAGQDAKMIELCTPPFEEKTGAKVIFDWVTADLVREKELTELAAGTGAYDIHMVVDRWFHEYYEAGYLIDLDTYIKKYGVDLEGYIPEHLNLFRKDDKMAGLPCTMHPGIIVYLKDRFAEAGLVEAPKTWDEYLEYAKKLTYDDKYGTLTMASRGGGTRVEFTKYLWAFGGDHFDENWKPIFNQEPGIKAIEYQKELMKYAPPGATGVGYYELISGFALGQAAMADFWAIHWSIWLENPEMMGSTVVGNVGYAPFPVGVVKTPPELSSWGLVIPKVIPDRQKDAAFQYIAWLSGDESARMVAEVGGLVPRIDTFKDPEILAKWPYMPMVLESPKGGRVVPPIPEWGSIEEILTAEVASALAEEKTPRKALDDAAEAVYRVMEEAGYYK